MGISDFTQRRQPNYHYPHPPKTREKGDNKVVSYSMEIVINKWIYKNRRQRCLLVIRNRKTQVQHVKTGKIRKYRLELVYTEREN